MHRGNRVDILKGVDILILVHHLAGYLLAEDPIEDCLGRTEPLEQITEHEIIYRITSISEGAITVVGFGRLETMNVSSPGIHSRMGRACPENCKFLGKRVRSFWPPPTWLYHALSF
jgi:hypothetical protein